MAQSEKEKAEKLYDAQDPLKQVELNAIESTFLKALTLAEKQGFGGKALSLYNEVIQKGRTDPITEDDFSEEQIKALRSVVQEKIAATGQHSGKIDYKDYHGKIDTQILGGFKYDTKDGQTTITDMYDFNTDRAGAGDDSLVVQALGAVFGPRNLAAHIGRKIRPSGMGVPVIIKLPKAK